MFNCHRTAATLVLKPCCLPEWNHTYTHDRWVIAGSEHVIETREVCAQGKWSGNRWRGPPRSHLRPKFEKWCDALCRAVDVSEDEKRRETIEIQLEGGHQNEFVFATRASYERTPGIVAGVYATKSGSPTPSKKSGGLQEGSTRDDDGTSTDATS
jgi:hypothetical protein